MRPLLVSNLVFALPPVKIHILLHLRDVIINLRMFFNFKSYRKQN